MSPAKRKARKRVRSEDDDEDAYTYDSDGDDNEKPMAVDPEKRQRKTGVIYIQTVPPLFTVSRMREELSRYAEVGRIFLQVSSSYPCHSQLVTELIQACYFQAEKRRVHGKKRKQYTEGWVEFSRKRDAKRVARMLNGQLIGGKRRSAAYDTLWAMKYLSG